MNMEEIISNIVGVSYVGKPRSNTAVFIAKKVDYLLEQLYKVDECIVFAEKTISVSEKLQAKHCIVLTDHPQAEYTAFVIKLSEKERQRDRERRYSLTEENYYLGENVHIGENSYIEPGCLIGHDVVIGKNASICAGAVIKNAIIGDDFTAGEGAIIGSEGFTLTKDDNENWIHIPTLGKVRIGNHVDIGVHDNISRGTADDTLLDDYIKLDAFVYIGHDTHLKTNTEIASGGIVGGYVSAEEKTCIGINATIRNRITLGKGCMVGMGAVVTKSVEAETTVVGNPARKFEKK